MSLLLRNSFVSTENEDTYNFCFQLKCLSFIQEYGKVKVNRLYILLVQIFLPHGMDL